MYTGFKKIEALPDTNIVDWVLIELRNAVDASSATESAKVGRQAAWLLNDGSVVDLDGSSNTACCVAALVTNNLFVVIWHRNHLGVMSAFPLAESGGVYSYDFSLGIGQAFGGSLAQKEITPGIWGLIGGDGNADGEVNNEDKNNFWSILAGRSGYLSGDYDFDGNVNNIDKNDIWRINLNNGSQVPE